MSCLGTKTLKYIIILVPLHDSIKLYKTKHNKLSLRELLSIVRNYRCFPKIIEGINVTKQQISETDRLHLDV
jgi:hypothetical protein